jgi:hypothetical protein
MLKHHLNPVSQKLATLALMLISIVFMSACLLQILEQDEDMPDFFTAVVS